MNSHISIGISGDQARELVNAVTRGEWRNVNRAQQRRISMLEHQLGVSSGALANFFTTLGEKNVPAAELPQRLGEIARHYLELKYRLSSSTGVGSAVTTLREQAQRLLDRGDLSGADQVLASIARLEEDATAGQLAQRAETLAQRGQLARSQLRLLDAAEFFGQAASLAAARSRPRMDYLRQKAEALYDFGRNEPDVQSLITAVQIFNDLLQTFPREMDRQAWAAIADKLGEALQSLGQHTSSAEPYRKAVEAHRAALQIFSEKGQATAWADANFNLAEALQRLARFTSDSSLLAPAKAALKASSRVYDHKTHPTDWAAIQVSLAALTNVSAQISRDPREYEAAIELCRAALGVTAPDNRPDVWTAATLYLSTALISLAVLRNDEGLVKQGIQVAEDLSVSSGTAVPRIGRGAAQKAEAEAYDAWSAMRGGSPEQLRLAVAAYRSASDIFTREKAPRFWAFFQLRIGEILYTLGSNDNASLVAAIEPLQQALSQYRMEETRTEWLRAKSHLAAVLSLIGRRKPDAAFIKKAVEIDREALAAVGGEQDLHDRLVLELSLAFMLTELHRMTGDPSYLAEAEGYAAGARPHLDEDHSDVVAQSWKAVAAALESGRARSQARSNSAP